ncbi:class I SAM-dependent methyltransferase [Streptomyces daliensis]|uniref:Class I SAM-dependent methyltransferase n=1 Tax=Streptomyces daliensis TaxID=299421 RepID=A0A8T4ILP4_9ACTN|nr:class I SAM-dependent methyltransferase [Streptomyces daliensis]
MPEDIGIYDLGDLYDAIYSGRGKDYGGEAAVVARHVRTAKPDATTLLDVGSGTGGHLAYFAKEFAHAEGIDLAEGMLEVSRRNLPDISVRQGDMRSFRLERRFDAVVSLFSAVGNLKDTAELDETLDTFAKHLVPGGVVVVEPWWFPENFLPDYVGGSVQTVDGRTVARVSHTVRQDEGHSRMEVHYTVGDPADGIQHFSDVHVMALFTREEYEAAFTRAGCSVHYVAGEYEGNGLFVGVKNGSE